MMYDVAHLMSIIQISCCCW